MLKEHDRVVLTEDLPGKGLEVGDVGVIVFVPNSSDGYTIEFIALDGSTVAVAAVRKSQVRPVSSSDLPHVRRIPA